MENDNSKDKPAAEKWDLPGQPTKAERDAAFREECKKLGLTAEQIVERVSFFPILPRDRMRIIHCPDLPDKAFGEIQSDEEFKSVTAMDETTKLEQLRARILASRRDTEPDSAERESWQEVLDETTGAVLGRQRDA